MMFELMSYGELLDEEFRLKCYMDRLRKEQSVPPETRVTIIKRLNEDRKRIKHEIKERC
mgnify:CR=1 FL=1